MMDLTTDYLGLKLKSPLVASASPLNTELDNLLRLQAAGAGAVVLPSVFEEQIVREQIGATCKQFGGSASIDTLQSFRPGRPVPTHRIVVS